MFIQFSVASSNRKYHHIITSLEGTESIHILQNGYKCIETVQFVIKHNTTSVKYKSKTKISDNINISEKLEKREFSAQNQFFWS